MMTIGEARAQVRASRLLQWLRCALAGLVAGLCCASLTARADDSATVARLPKPDHIVVVIEENKSYDEVIGNAADAPFIHELARIGTVFTQAYGVMHPSQPNYLALFSGRTHGVRDDRCPVDFHGANLATLLQARGYTFRSYAEGLRTAGDTGCRNGAYVRKHNPAADWASSAGPDINLPLTALPRDYAQLPTVAFIIPDVMHDMHDGSMADGDRWLRANLAGYVRWAYEHNSLLILTWDEGYADNHMPTFFVGPMVKPGPHGQRITHYEILRTIADMYGLPAPHHAAEARPITGIWRGGPGDL